MKIGALLRTHAGTVVVFGGVAFGGGFALLTQYSFPRMWDISFPGTLITITACFLVGLCWGEAMWQFMRRPPFRERTRNDV
jgi:hypothetical protein